MIHAFNFTGARDLDLADLMKNTLCKYCAMLASFESKNVDGMGYGNGFSWESSMLKLDALRELVKNKEPKDYDWILSVDSDVVFLNRQFFEWLNVVQSFRYNNYSIIGIMQTGPLAQTAIGPLNNMSGCSLYIKADIAKKIVALTQQELDSVREQFKAYVLCENEDVILSYLAQMLGAKALPIPEFMYNGDLNDELTNGKPTKSFYHLNYSPTEFLGVTCSGKWDIPRILRLKGIEL